MKGECITDFKGESEGLLSQQYNNCKVKFMNDVQGMAYGVHFRKDDSKFVKIENKSHISSGGTQKTPKILFTMGTGTGLSIIYPYKDDPNPLILPTECWASQFSPDI